MANLEDDFLKFKQKYRYNIYKTPDGEDCAKKVAVMTAYGAVTGGILGFVDVLIYTNPPTWLGTAIRMQGWLLPVAGMGAAYPAFTCICANIRKKDDPLNHLISGFLAGTLVGRKFKNRNAPWIAGIGVGLLAAITKLAVMNNITLMKEGWGTKYHPPALTLRGYERSFFGGKRNTEGNQDQ